MKLTDIRQPFITNLRRALDENTATFNRQYRNGAWDRVHGTEDITGTAICMIGLDRAGVHDVVPEHERSRMFSSLLARTRASRYAGAVGLLIWMAAVLDLQGTDGALFDIFPNAERDLEGFCRRLTTMELAWLLSGLLHRVGDRRAETRAAEVLATLASRCSPTTGLMFQCDSRAPWRHRVRRHIATFADQIYTLQAVAFAKLRDVSLPARLDVMRLAREILRLQGPRGQWWWHFDVETGEVAAHYPVFSVHQLSMAPMGMRAAEAAFGFECRDALLRSTAWCADNESGGALYDQQSGTVWRSVEIASSPIGRKLHRVASMARMKRGWATTAPVVFHVNQETRPYEWGWWLYADAIAANFPRGRHVY